MVIERVSGAWAGEAIEVLATAFEEYPFLVRAFEGARHSRPAMLRQMFGIALDYRVALDIPAFAAVDQGRVLGVATLSVPDSPELPQEFVDRWDALDRDVSPEGRALFEAYEALQKETVPDVPHVYVVAVGVLPTAQGGGIGRALIEAAQRFATALPGVEGVALDTHDPANVPKYRAMGFGLVTEKDLLGLPNWFFWDRG